MYLKSDQTKTKPKKKISQTKLTQELDDLIRQVFKKQTEKGFRECKCFICGKEIGYFSARDNPYGLQVGHFVTRSCYPLRWDFKNLEWNCSDCNRLHELDFLPFTNKMLKEYGQERIDYLTQKKEEYKKAGKSITVVQKLEIKEELERILKNL
jgi:hypothetical protein